MQGKIETLRKDLAKTEGHHSEAADDLRDTETAISTTNRHLRDLADNRSALSQELAGLNAQVQRLERQIGQQQNQISALLYRQYLRGDADALKLLMSGADPNQTARDWHFLTLLSQAKTEMVSDLREAQAEKQKLGEAVRERTEKLAENERKQQEQKQTLLAQQKQRQAVLARIADKLRNQRKDLDTLRRDEKRLGNLIASLARPVAKPAAASRKPVAGSTSGNERERVVARNEVEPDRSLSGVFAALKGKLRLPVRGDIANRFGSARADGGATWKGIFIRASEGSEVKSIAAGQVVFADWLRGFGNLLVIDHGDGFLSVYGNNQSLLREAGAKVKPGEIVASVGNSGGNPESGLYFELRHQGQAQDPLKWVTLR